MGNSYVPLSDGVDKTIMWQNQYIGDSGIHSGATTQAHSVSSKHGPEEMDSSMDPNQLVFDLDHGFAQGFTQEQVNGMHCAVDIAGLLYIDYILSYIQYLHRDDIVVSCF